MKNRTLGFALALAVLSLATAVRAQEADSAARVPTGFFLQIQGSGAFFLKNSLTVQKDLSYFGEMGSLAESYTYGTAPAIDAALGTYLQWGRMTLKIGLGYQKSFRNDAGSYVLTLPHPIETGSPRTVAFASDDLSDTSTSLYIFGLFSLIQTKAVNIWLGPILGLGMDKFATLDDFAVTEASPHLSDDISITDIKMIETSVSSLWFGVQGDAEFTLSRPFALVISARLLYDDPKLAALGHRANLFRIEAAAGCRIIF